MIEKIRSLPGWLKRILSWIVIAIIFIPIVLYASSNKNNIPVATVTGKKSKKKVKASDESQIDKSTLETALSESKSIIEKLGL